MDTLELLKTELAKKGVNVDNLNLDSTLKDLGMDSLDTIEVMVDIEEMLNIAFSDDELAGAKNVKDVIDLIDKKK